MKKIILNENKNISLVSSAGNNINIVVLPNVKASIFIEIDSDLSLDFNILANSYCDINLINKGINNSISITGKIEKESLNQCVFADFSSFNVKFKSNIELIGEGSSSNFLISATSRDKNIKDYDINFNHLSLKTESKIKFFGVSMNNSLMKVKGISCINNKCVKSNAVQDVKVILFDKESRGSASPILKIECDDIKASHACSIGSINDEHLYYLLSRGLDIVTVRKLIVLGYVSPIKQYFNEENKKFIDEFIEREFNNDRC